MYTIYADGRGGNFSQRVSDYARGTHRWIYKGARSFAEASLVSGCA